MPYADPEKQAQNNRERQARYRLTAKGRARAAKEVERQRELRRTAEGKRRTAAYHHKAVYGLSRGEYERMHAEQRGLCAVCGQPEIAVHPRFGLRRLAVDHCHTTGAVRGLLCSRCNTALGLLREDLKIVENLKTYISWHRCMS